MLELIECLGLLYPNETSKTKVRYGLYKCSCGNIKKIQTPMVKNGRTISCGCHVKNIAINLGKSRRKHNDRGTRLYRIWQGMLNRCRNKNAINFESYGNKNISVCNDWKNWEYFKIWSNNNGYNENLTIDRINSNGNYEPNNCRWVSMSEQMANKNISSANTTGYKGVLKNGKKWYARVQFKGIVYTSKVFDTIIEAAIAYDTLCDENNLPNRRNFEMEVYHQEH